MRLTVSPGHAFVVPSSLVQVARAHAGRFVTEASPALLSVAPGRAGEGWRDFGPDVHEPGAWLLDGDVLRYDIGPGAYAAETVLRVAWQVVAGRIGGLLLHASAVAVGEVAWVACGPSGAGKTTFARQAVQAGATLLSDEMVLLLPDGRVVGTPFYSEAQLVGGPHVARAVGLLVLHKAAAEAIDDVPPAQALGTFLPQCFECAGLTPPRLELRRRLLAFASRVPVRRHSFRKHPEAGRFVVEALSAAAAPPESLKGTP